MSSTLLWPDIVKVGLRTRTSSPTSHSNLFTALQEINDEFITGFLALADGEKDPRDLLVIFAIERVLILEFNTVKFTEVSSHHALEKPKLMIKQRLFDSICCYFPISFRPPPNDPYGITTEDLSSSLRFVFEGST